MTELKTNFNVAPFYDDYDEDKQYYRILFRPGTAVQARELTQLQTILQRQISRFGNSIYKDGSIIEGCNFTTFPRMAQVKFKDSNTNTLDFSYISADFFSTGGYSNSVLLVSNTTDLRATVFKAFDGAESVVDLGYADTNRAYVIYINTGNNGATSFSTASEQIDVYNSAQDKSGSLSVANRLGVVYTLSSNATVNALGRGYGMHVGAGVIYQKGFFQKTLPQNFIIREHSSNAAGIRVGFDTNEYIVKPTTDISLYDNSIGSTNYSAPGAYRLKLSPVPVYYDAGNTSVTVPANFLPVVEFDGGDGRIVELAKDPQLSILGDIMAKRTFEESGDYVVKPFQVDVTAHESNNALFYYTASPGIAYVDGYRVELLSPRRTVVERATSTNTAIDQPIRVSYGNYCYINEFAGIIDFQQLTQVAIYDQPQETLSKYQARTTPSGNLVGYCNIRSVKHHDLRKGRPSGEHVLYLFNVRMNTGKNFTYDAKSIYIDGSKGKVYADFVLNNAGGVDIVDPDLTRAIFDTGLGGVKSISNVGFVYRPTLTGTIVPSPTGSYAAFTLSGTDIYNYGVGFLSDVDSEDINIMFAQDTLANTIASNAYAQGANSTAANVNSITDYPFTGGLYVGSGIYFSNGSSISYNTVSAVNSANSITVVPNTVPGGVLTAKPFYKQGTHVDFTGSGNTVFVDSSTQVTINLEMTPDVTGYDFYAQIPVKRVNAQPIPKVVNKDRYVEIDCGTHPAGTTGPWCLGIPDVYNVANVFFGATYSETNADRSDWFYLDNGQTGAYYGLSYLKLLPKYTGVLSNSSKLLVKFDHFEAAATSTKMGFFDINSYPIDDVNLANTAAIQTAEIPLFTDITGTLYDLRNQIDFRAVMSSTANSATVIANATENPANNSTTFNLGGVGAQFVADTGSNFTYDVEYYLPRKDILTINKDGALVVKLGLPSLTPQTPVINKTGLALAELYVPPYPSLTFTEAE
ncbi:Domain of unknown function DUF4815 [uncultured Caudovirales phage]|uniref:DUF4815 domain-containing protein n=1 Tax=uncultured Caudovirales phage TaxID=2100421 RepID=A0A6J7WTH8_9CAUD|nr:Domain of unknown function DUF4815 [uncultured Caudovirales phage]